MSNIKQIKGIKVSLAWVEEEKALLAVAQKDGKVDPQLFSLTGDITDILVEIPDKIVKCQALWAAQPRMPAYKAPRKPTQPTQRAEKPTETATKPDAAPTTPTEGPKHPRAEITTDGMPLKAELGEAPDEGERAVPGETPVICEQAKESEAPIAEEPAVETPMAPEPTPFPEVREEASGMEAPGSQEPAPIHEAPTGGEQQAELEAPNAEPAPKAETPVTEPAEEPEPSEKMEPGFYLKDGTGPFSTVQLALDALEAKGFDFDGKRPAHNRWARLSKKLQEEIIPRA